MAKLAIDNVYDQQRALHFLQNALDGDRIAHAYLIHGPVGVGKLALATGLAAALMCDDGEKRPCGRCTSCVQFKAKSHPNLTLVFPHLKAAKEDEKLQVRQTMLDKPYELRLPWNNPVISIDAIRELRKQMMLRSQAGSRRVVILYQAHQMTSEATNALLKLLEEPPAGTYFLLLSSAYDKLLPTILSRCQHLQLHNLTTATIEQALTEDPEISAGDSDPRLIARLARGNLKRAYELAGEDARALKDNALELLRASFKKPAEAAAFATGLAFQHDRTQLVEILDALLLLLRDGLLVASMGPAAAAGYLTNSDAREPVEKFAAFYEHFDYRAAIREVERSMHMLERYVQPAVVLMVMLNSLRRYSRPALAA